jgi:hypothetical protein
MEGARVATGGDARGERKMPIGLDASKRCGDAEEF